MTGGIIYYVGLEVSQHSSEQLCRFYDIKTKRLHSTLAYSREWFPYKRLDRKYTIHPPYNTDLFCSLIVLCYSDIEITNRHKDFLSSGAKWNFDEFKSHITIGPIPFTTKVPDFQIIFSHEYYGTWREK